MRFADSVFEKVLFKKEKIYNKNNKETNKKQRWLFFRSGWGQKPSQERTLAIHLSRDGFDQILKAAREGRVPSRGWMSGTASLIKSG